MAQGKSQLDSSPQIYIDGRIVARPEAAVSVFDAGFQSGDAVWEGLRLYQRVVFRLSAHLERLEASARALRIVLPLDREHMMEAVYQIIDANHFTDGIHLRLIVTRGERSTSGMDPTTAPPRGSLIIIPEPKPVVADPAPLTLATSPIRRSRPDVLDPTIHHANQLNSILARLSAQDANADAALMLDADGFVAEADTANIFCVTDGAVLTPRPRACIRGITRGAVIALGRRLGYDVREGDLHLHEFYSASEVFLVGTLSELVPVSAVDGRCIGDGAPGPVWRDLLSAYRHLVVEECAAELHTLGTRVADSRRAAAVASTLPPSGLR